MQHVRRIAALSALAISDDQAEAYRGDLSRVLGYVDRLRSVPLEGVEPMATPLDTPAPLGADVEGPVLGVDVLMAMAPQAHEPFIRVPKVLGEGGGA